MSNQIKEKIQIYLLVTPNHNKSWKLTFETIREILTIWDHLNPISGPEGAQHGLLSKAWIVFHSPWTLRFKLFRIPDQYRSSVASDSSFHPLSSKRLSEAMLSLWWPLQINNSPQDKRWPYPSWILVWLSFWLSFWLFAAFRKIFFSHILSSAFFRDFSRKVGMNCLVFHHQK